MARFSEQDYREMPPELLRAIIREHTHHRLEEPVYRWIHEGKAPPPGLGEGIRQLLNIWTERGLPEDGADLTWTRRLLTLAGELNAGAHPSLKTRAIRPFSRTERRAAEKLIFTRRSVRRWSNKAVPSALIEKVIEAGLWAPHACNLQTLRFLVVQDQEGLALFKKSEITGGNVRIVVCQDLRPYQSTAGVPEHNRLLDCGAAVQNMLLMAHALGLGAVWLTFSEPQVKQLRAHYQLPDYIAIQTYLALGWPAESPLRPGRLTVADVVLNPRGNKD